MLRLYAFGLRLVFGLLPIASLFSSKINRFLKSRRKEKEMFYAYDFPDDLFWFHCSSLGEYEQAKPLIEFFLNEGKFCLVSFFSSSGYEVLKPKETDKLYFTYLPLEKSAQLNQFLQKIKPQKVFWVKNELWLLALSKIQKLNIPNYLVSARFYENHFVAKFWAHLWRQCLKGFTKIFVQDTFSYNFLKELELSSINTGDLRFDNVLQLAQKAKSYEKLIPWVENKEVLVVGSSWKEEEEIALDFWIKNPSWKIILAPHDISVSHIQPLEEQLQSKKIKYAKWSDDSSLDEVNVLVIDNIGMLSSLYKLASIAFVGGGFSGKLHNVLEPMVYDVPVVCGPFIDKFWEAKLAAQKHVLHTIYYPLDLQMDVPEFLNSPSPNTFIRENSGALSKIIINL